MAFYNQWKTPTTTIYTGKEVTDWLVMCGQNKNAGVQLANGVERSIKEDAGGSGGEGDEQLAINGQGEGSDWAVHGLTIWDRHLSRVEITAASNAYLTLLSTGGSAVTMRT